VHVRSLGLITELALAATRGKVVDRGDYIVVERADLPEWAAGNYLVLPRAPEPGELARWTETFARELGDARAIALRWDDRTGEDAALGGLRAAGFTIDTSDVLDATDVLAAPHAMPMRELDSGEVLSTSILAWTISDRHDEVMRKLMHARCAWYAELVDRGQASFWGAFDGTRLVASCGLVQLDGFELAAPQPSRLARYQDVQTLPAYRRRGLAGALLAAAARRARTLHIARFVIFCEPGTEATRVYRRVGFQLAERIAIARRAISE
jgi:GNAT superfamily N-acetyltransferase